MPGARQVHGDKGMTEPVDLAHLPIDRQIRQDRGESKFFLAVVQGAKCVVQRSLDTGAHVGDLIADFV
jgi:hypothetical protein